MTRLPLPEEPAPPPEDAAAPPATELVRGAGRRSGLVLTAILALMVVYTLYFARDLLVPIAIAVILNLLLSPVVLRLRRLHIPDPLGAALVVAVLVGILGWGVYALSSPAAEWLHKAPGGIAEIEGKLHQFKRPMQVVAQAAKEVENLARVGPPAAPTVVKERSLAQTLASGTALVVAQLMVIVILLYFLLASGDTFLRRLVKAMSSNRDKRRAVEITRAVQRDITTYLGTVTVINVGLGSVTAIAMAIIGMPDPVLWGVVATAFNFIPYVGALTTTVILAVVGLLSFDNVGHALLAPGLFQLFTNIESNLVTPTLLGRNLTLNPALVFLALVVWSWMWGVPGALLAVPFLVMLKIFADHITALRGISIFLGRRDPG